jgi:hypothetical protein
MIPGNWRNGQRPSGKAAASSLPAGQTASSSNTTVTSTPQNTNSAPSSATSNKSPQNGSSNGSAKNGVKPEGTAAQSQSGSELDQRIAALQDRVLIKLYRWVPREYDHTNQPHLVRDIQQKKKILDVLESATRGLRRREAVLDRVPEQQVVALPMRLPTCPHWSW